VAGSSSSTGSGRGRSGTGRTGPFRAHARRGVRLRALVTHVSAGWQRQATVENMSLGGARVLLDQAVAPGDPLTLSFTAPTLWDPLVLRARVAWVGAGALPRAVGLAFEHKGSEAVFALYELIAALGYE
jgi:hypothetical protein